MNHRSTGRPVVHFQSKIIQLLLDVNLLAIQITGDIDEMAGNSLLCKI